MIVARYHIGHLLQAGATGILIFPGDHHVAEDVAVDVPGDLAIVSRR